MRSKDIQKTSDELSQRYGYDISRSTCAVGNRLKQIIQIAINKLIQMCDRRYRKEVDALLTEERRKVVEDTKNYDIKVLLFSFLLEKNITKITTEALIKRLKKFFAEEDNPSVFVKYENS